MKSENKETNNNKEQKRLKILPESNWLGIAMIVTGFAEVIFLMFVLALDVLPLKYLMLLVVMLILVDALIVYLANSPSKHGTRRIGSLVVIFTMLIVLLTGDYYVYCTSDTLSKISQQRDMWEYYKVVALKEGNCQTADDIDGKMIYVAEMDSKQLNEARERLVTKSDVTYTELPNIIEVGKRLVPDAEEKTDDENENEDINVAEDTTVSEDTTAPEDALILVSESQRKLLCDNLDGFKKSTQTIYKMKVKKRSDDNSKAVDVTKDSFNVLISGMDVWGSIDQEALSDVNMVMTVNPETRTVLLTSIPRDSYIPLHSYGAKDKLTHSGIYGSEETKKTIEDFLGIDINYTIKVNFSMLRDLVDAVGGIDVYNDTEFVSSVKGWHYAKGWRHMMGNKTLWFARERKSFMDGDMKRNENQQIVLKALIKKVTSSRVILTRYASILNAVEDSMWTDMKDSDLKKLAKMQLKDMKPWTINRINIKGATGGAPCFSMGNQELSCVFPDPETVEEAKEAIHDTMYPVNNSTKDKTKKTTEDKTDEENSTDEQ